MYMYVMEPVAYNSVVIRLKCFHDTANFDVKSGNIARLVSVAGSASSRAFAGSISRSGTAFHQLSVNGEIVKG